MLLFTAGVQADDSVRHYMANQASALTQVTQLLSASLLSASNTHRVAMRSKWATDSTRSLYKSKKSK